MATVFKKSGRIIYESTVLQNQMVGPNTFLLTIDYPTQNEPILALGRFARLRAWPYPPFACGPLLDRPFSIHKSTENSLQFLIRCVGPSTAILSNLTARQSIEFLGPLGRGLDLVYPDYKKTPWYLAAGGAGLGPMATIKENLEARLFYGERTKENQVSADWLSSWAGDFVAACDDGSGYGFKGPVTGPLAEALEKEKRPVFACGPPLMLKAISDICRMAKVPFLASAEAFMGCGLGVCLSCSMPKKSGGRIKICCDGPVVDGRAINFETLT
ncbi:MAG: hypothetical protein LBE31_10440 [Deltaproteobacteria bacterium]|jgi:dihydroorotate dehydrogenase electron transfer subunit|nr:hypothetical protein [Deltaproteobacteria bacterium]